MADLLEQSDELRSEIPETFLKIIPQVEDDVYTKILELLDSFNTSDGYFTTSNMSAAKLVRIENEIIKILTDAGYFKSANTFIQDLTKITTNTELLHRGFNKIDISNQSMTAIEKLYAQRAVNMFSKAGLNDKFISPITTVVNEAITFGYSIQNTRNTLQDFVKGGKDTSGKLGSYLTITARDTVTQLQGAQHQKVLTDYDLKFIRYTGGLLKDSAGQCVHWYGMKFIPVANLQAEIDLAFSNQAKKLIKPKGHRWAGFIKTTTPENFCIYRGHLGCIHQAFPVRSNNT